MIGGFAGTGMPSALIDAPIAQGARNLTIVNNNAGIGGIFSPTGYDTLPAEGKETQLINGRYNVVVSPIHADFALI